MKKIALLFGVATVLAVALGTATAAPASAPAAVMRQTFTFPLSDTGLTDGCHPGLTETPGTFVHTTAHVDFGNTYSADGTFLFTVTFHQIEHYTITNGVVSRVDFVMNHVQGGQCSSQ